MLLAVVDDLKWLFLIIEPINSPQSEDKKPAGIDCLHVSETHVTSHKKPMFAPSVDDVRLL